MKRSGIFLGSMVFLMIVLTLALAMAVMSGTGSQDEGLQGNLHGNELLGVGLQACVLPDGQYYYWGDTWGSRGISVGQFSYPSSIMIGPDNSVYVAERNLRIQKFGADGKWSLVLTDPAPSAMTIDGNGMIFVLEEQKDFQYLYGIDVIDGTINTNIDRRASCGITKSLDMAIKFDNYFALYVTTDNGFWRIRPLPGEAQLTDLQFPASSPYRLNKPWGVAVSLNGDVYVADSGNNRIEVIRNNGKIETWGSQGSGPGQFNHPKGLALDLDGNVYVADSGNDRIQMFDPDGVFIGSMGNSRSLNNPTDVAVDSHYNVYVVDTDNHRIRKLVLSRHGPA